MSAKNIIEKIWDLHVVDSRLLSSTQDRERTQLNSPPPSILAIDCMLIHEVTSAQAFTGLRSSGHKPYDVNRLFATLDHSIPTRVNRFEIFDDSARSQVEMLRKNCLEFKVPLFDFDSGYQGIVHVIGPELGITLPGMTIVCGDSHTSTHGAFGALAFGIGTSEVGHVLTTSCLLQRKPKTMRVNFIGEFSKGVFAKDAVLALIAKIGIAGANEHIIEYSGDAVSKLSMEERMTICNMSIECGARAGLMAPDKTTYEYLKGRPYAPSDSDWPSFENFWNSLCSDKDCTYDKEIEIDLNTLKPMVTWGTNPEQGIFIDEFVPTLSLLPKEKQESAMRALKYTKLTEGAPLKGVEIQWGFIGSCTNGRLSDLKIAAEVLKDRKISSNVTLYIVPGSERIKSQAEELGLDKIFTAAGASWRSPGCSMCLGMNDDKVPSGARCISTSNRNFIGRQGTGSITHLASPATVAASAIAGRITSPASYL
jgi:3-isopropylmalate/(R)-2-methylmalate dehydratase large subunit